MKFDLRARVVSEFLGTAFLVAAVVGSGIMGERLAGGNVAIALLANTIATGAALVGLILTFRPISGAHFNPAVTLADAFEHGTPWKEVPTYIIAQCTGGIPGTGIAHLSFGLRSFALLTRSEWTGARLKRIRRDLRTLVGNLGLLAFPLVCRTLRGRELHHGCLLVHCIHVLR